VDGESTLVNCQYIWGILGRADLIQRKRSTEGLSLNESLFVLRDRIDPVAIADGNGSVVERYSYDVYGNVNMYCQNFSDQNRSNYKWTYLYHGKFIDQLTGYYNYGYRYYFASLGQWLSRDPLEEKEGPNLYKYVNNNPLIYIDADGRSACCCILEGIGVYKVGKAIGDGTCIGKTGKELLQCLLQNILKELGVNKGKDALNCLISTVSTDYPGQEMINDISVCFKDDLKDKLTDIAEMAALACCLGPLVVGAVDLMAEEFVAAEVTEEIGGTLVEEIRYLLRRSVRYSF
jgi:RHS repeat-associated protein